MTLQIDSVAVPEAAEETVPKAHRTHYEFKASDVIARLPRDATPAQQDSAVQAAMPHRTLVLSTKPDTLCLPGLPADIYKFDIKKMPKAYEESFFKNNPHLHPEVSGGAMGKTASPLAYTLQSDDLVTSTLLLCFFLMMLILGRGRRFLTHSIKRFTFDTLEKNDDTKVETGGELYSRFFMLFQTSFLMGILGFDFIQTFQPELFDRISPFLLLGSSVGACLLYFCSKWICYNFVNWVFFDKTQRVKWIDSYLLLVSLVGIVLFPIVLIVVYFNMDLKSALICVLVVFILAKMLLLWKCFNIFFVKNFGILHLIVYFCALEILPMVALWQIWNYLSNSLITIF